MTFTADIQDLHDALRLAITMSADDTIDPVLKELATEAYALGMKRGIERTHHQVRKVVFTLVFMLLGCIWLGYLASLTV